jgi:hypothetical protein
MGLGVFLAAASMAGAASAAVTISTDATSHMRCAAGLCKPTAADAVLNVKKLVHLLNTGSVTIESGSTAQDIVVAASVQWVHNSALVLDAYRSLAIDALVRPKGAVPITIKTDDGGTGGLLTFGSAGRVSFLSTLSPTSSPRSRRIAALDITRSPTITAPAPTASMHRLRSRFSRARAFSKACTTPFPISASM